MSKPYFSLCAILGDPQVQLLPRALRSLIERPEGPAANEIVIGWNGYRDEAFMAAWAEFAGRSLDDDEFSSLEVDNPDSWIETEVSGVSFIIHRQTFIGDFSATRNGNFGMANGVWRGYFDFDDQLSPQDSDVVRQSIEIEHARNDNPIEYGQLHLDTTGKAWPDRLRELPEYVNVVYAPYNYVMSEKDRPLLRIRRPRIVRWSDDWCWIQPVHEMLRSTIGREVPVVEPSFVLVHDPVQTTTERSARNYTILEHQVEDAEQSGEDLSAFTHYGLGCKARDRHDFEFAVEQFKGAAKKAPTPEDKLLYLQEATRAYLNMERGLEAGQCAQQMIEVAPTRAEGYLMASEAAYCVNKLEYCLSWYEASLGKDIPPNTMRDDRIERLIRPVQFAAPAYLKCGMPEKALEVAEIALKEAPDQWAMTVKAQALKVMAKTKEQRTLSAMVDQLLDQKLFGTALRMLSAIKKSRGSAYTFEFERQVKRHIGDLKGLREPVHHESKIGQWLTTSPGPADLGIVLPVDRFEDPLPPLTQLAEGVDNLFFCVTDPEDYREDRLDPISAEGLLALGEQLGEVRELQLVGGSEDETRHLGIQVRCVPPTEPWQPDVTFWCPIMAEPWGPWGLARGGMGGSEESVVYLSRELAKAGLRVQVYAPMNDGLHRGVHVEQGVRWKPLDSFDPRKHLPGVAIAHRAPWAVRFPAFDLNSLYIWHQDAQYLGSSNAWSRPTAEAARHLWVSEWQEEALCNPAGIEPGEHGVVLGNGIPDTCFTWQETNPKRDPFKCIYASAPIRGLVELLDAWPEIIKAEPRATLDIYYGWETTPQQFTNLRETVMQVVSRHESIRWMGRTSQLNLEHVMSKAGVWLYPCQFPEGYAIAGVRATAAGMIPVYRAPEGSAMEEIHYPSKFKVSDAVWNEGGREEFITAAVKALAESGEGTWDRIHSSNWTKRYLWGHTAQRLIEDMVNQGHFELAVADLSQLMTGWTQEATA